MTTAALLTVRAAPELAPAPVDELRAWLRLAHASGLRPIALRALLAEFGSPQAVLAQSFSALATIAGGDAAKAVLAPPPRFDHGFDEYVERAVEWASAAGNHVLTLADTAYPRALLTMPDPPPLLYVKGRLELLQMRAVAIVGSRSATPQGIEDARRFARALADAGLTVVSGLALGIDAAAHGGALEGAASTIAVIGTGADLVYPSKNRELAHRIAELGAIVSEWPLGTPARSENFPQRNRIIAGLVGGVLIVEAAMRSGSLITARLANEMGRDVFAMPGSIHAPLARGCHRMIRQGAKLVETPEDVLEEFGLAVATVGERETRRHVSGTTRTGLRRHKSGTAKNDTGDKPAQGRSGTPIADDWSDSPPADIPHPPPATASWASARAAPPPASDPDTDRLLTALGHSPTTLEILAARTELEGAMLQSLLLQLELAGRIETLPGGRFVRIER
ncbi:DNA protecting protein DprA [Caballeronia choica]|jgi:DNA processing protein|uniref:DNA protecting protein DprA n=1 Tax=Caballeronia choica TaxID=326476 RepID=A0A158FIH1_9BURK|nr:DNA-processing protein DprA [Caballeronia choica]SAL19119.1 DNA protecting protein DprA [Caballeronia choica]